MTELQLRILIVDDLEAMRSLVKLFLRRHPFVEVVAEASDGEQAVALCKEYIPDVVLCDISLPGDNGVDVGRKIKELFPTIRVYLYSAFELNEYRELQIHSPIDGFIQKSALKDELAAMIMREIEQKKQVNS